MVGVTLNTITQLYNGAMATHVETNHKGEYQRLRQANAYEESTLHIHKVWL